MSHHSFGVYIIIFDFYNWILCFSDGKEVGLVYFRAGYAPDHFKSQEVNKYSKNAVIHLKD